LDATVLWVFAFVYAGMVLGRVPGLALDRTGIALLGAIALIALEKLSPEEAWRAVDVPTLALLFGLMVISAQLRLGGFYTRLTLRLGSARLSPRALLGALVAATGALSALLANDIVCLAIAPVLVEVCARRRLDPVPFLLGLACAANVGSAATLIGNPQNMLVGQTLGLSFAGYLVNALVPAALGLALVWWIIGWRYTDRWQRDLAATSAVAVPFDAWQSAKGLAVILVLVALFLATSWPRDVLALAAGGILLTSRRMHSREVLGLVDWQLLVLFVGLFIVNRALADSGTTAAALAAVGRSGVDLEQPPWLFAATVLLSNVVSNVPAVMLLLPAATHPLGGTILALASTLAGNLILVGSIANLIVVDQAARRGVRITWREHAAVGVPVTIATLAVAAAWLWLRSAM
jgi:Na+/H+ antiporter NhaD/arsenite permease-like protein